jgi:tape measure domain-containing protein
MSMGAGGWETEVVIQISEEGAAATDAAIKRVTRSLKQAQEAAKNPVTPFGKGSGSMQSDFGVDKMEKATGSLFHMGIEYERTSNKMKSPLGGYNENMQLTAKNFTAAAKGVDALGNKAPPALKKVETGFGDAARAVRIFRTLVIATGLEQFISNIVTTTDKLTNLQNKIKVVADDQDHANYIFKQSVAIAAETRTGLTDVATVYSRTSRAIKEMGVSTTATLQFTKTLSKAVAVGGSTAIEASQAMIQLSQGLASGKLSGDELRSVLEQLPVVADLIAKHMGVGVGELRKLGAAGKITAKEIFEAVTSATKEMDDEFAKMTPTFEKGWQAIVNGATEAAAVFQPTVTSLAQVMIDFGDSFKFVATTAEMLVAQMGAGSKFMDIMDVLSYLPKKAGGAVLWMAEGLSAFSGGIGLGDPWEAVAIAKEAAKIDLQNKADDAELARLEQEYYDSFVTPEWKKATPTPNKEGGLTFEEMMLKAERDRERAALPEFEAGVLKDVEGRIGSLKKSLQEAIQSNPGGMVDPRLEQLFDMVNLEHAVLQAKKDQLEEEKLITEDIDRRLKIETDLIELGNKKSVEAGAHEGGNLIKTKEKAEAASRAFEAGLNPLTAYNNAVLDANTYIHDHQEMLKNSPELYRAIEHSITKLNPAYQALAEIGDQLGKSIADAAANALIFGDNLSQAFTQIAKAAAAQMISNFIQLGVNSLGGLMGGPAVPGITGDSPTLTRIPMKTVASGGYMGYGPGGYTGNGNIGDIAGVVHGKEFVVNSNATARNRATLEAMNAGKPVGGSGTTVNVHNYAGVEVSTQTNSRGEIEVMIKKAIAEQAPGVIAGDMQNANGRTAKALSRAYETTRRR